MKRLILLCLLLLISSLSQVWADERILEFHSDIRVFPSGSIYVQERITVRAEGKQIKRGIFRDIPTEYLDRFGYKVSTGFELNTAGREGEPTPYHTEKLSNGIRIYIGHKNRYLEEGTYTYYINYRMHRALGFFEDHDELYWNVTGNDWAFPIDRATASIVLPPTVQPSMMWTEAYTGPQGSKGQAYYSEIDDKWKARFETTETLKAEEGLTIVVTWPKGHVEEPTTEDKIRFLVEDNRPLVISLAGLAILMLYYLLIWHRVGRDPDSGVIIPLYNPPRGYSPSSMRFIRRMGYDHKAFATALVNLAIKGYLEIDETSDKEWKLTKTGQVVEMAPGESALVSKLFSGGDSITLKQSNHSRIGKAVKAHKRSLKGNYESKYFQTNSIYLIPGVLISIALLAGAVFAFENEEALAIAGFMSIWLTGWSLGTYALIAATISAWKGARSGGGYGSAIGTTLFALPFVGFWFFGVGMLIHGTSISFLIVLLLTIGINIAFYQLMKAPTLTGRKLLDKVEGFRQYLDVAEGDELATVNQLKDIGLYEKFLPYALALDVEQAWSNRFADALAKINQQEERYRPRWYSGSNWNHRTPGAFATGLGSALSGAIASSSRAPGSSSGSGGGGSSGGGGGGGGGGGW
jgi:hypothetical protein